MIDETASAADSPRRAALNAALAGAMIPPATPSDLRAGVLAAIAREPAVDPQAQRRNLLEKHRADIAKLNQRYLRRCRDAVLLGACLLAALGVSIKPLSQGLTPLFADAAPMVAGFLALSVGVVCGAVILQDLFKGGGNEVLRGAKS